MHTVLTVLQVIIAVLLSLVILTQAKGTGLSATFGGTGGFYTSKRGAEKVLHITTVVLAILFAISSLAFLFV